MAINLVPIYNEQTPPVSLVEEFDDNLVELCQSLLIFAKAWKEPVLAGLAANQLALDGQRILKRVCCVRTEEENWIVAVNPIIFQKTGKTKENYEGCLTWPGKTIVAERHESVVIQYQDVEGNNHNRSCSGFESIVWQHEINHLDGIYERVVHPKTGRIFGPSVGMTTIQKSIKVKPNSPCKCGSGKKFKKCCGR